MTKKNYLAIAHVLNYQASIMDIDKQYIIDEVAMRLTELFAKTNNKFNSEKFLTACGFRNWQLYVCRQCGKSGHSTCTQD